MSDYEQRMHLLRPWLSWFKRRFSVLDLGCGDGQIIRAISREFDASCFAVERGFGESEEYGLEHYAGTRITCLRTNLSALMLRQLADCEHFDVVLALNFLHHFGEDWRRAASAVLRMGRIVFVQIPRVESKDVPGAEFMGDLTELIADQGTLIGQTVQFPGHLARPLWIVPNAICQLPRTTMYREDGVTPQEVAAEPIQVVATEHQITGWRGDRGEWPWIVGMNLWNLLHLGLVRPTTGEMAKVVREFPVSGTHGDIVPWNFIWDGEKLHLIDKGGEGNDVKMQEQAARMVEG